MGKRKREDDDDDNYVDFCQGLQQYSRDGVGDNSYIYSSSRRVKRPKINPNFYKPTTVEYNYLDKRDHAYQHIASLITNRSIVIDDIVEVQNTALEAAYNLKKEQKLREYGAELREELLFHGTKECNVGSICRFNFDWRLTGSNKGHKFGKGICFSRNAKYASSYSEAAKHYKVMIVAKVLIAKTCRGHHDMSMPPQGFDTSQKGKDGIVLVKYEDNEFYPAYILYYHFQHQYDRQDWSFCTCRGSWCHHRRYDHHGDYYTNDCNYDFWDYGNHGSGVGEYNCSDDFSDYNYNRERYHSGHHHNTNHHYNTDHYHNTHYDHSTRNRDFYNSQNCSDNYSFQNDGEYQDCDNYYSF